jgi:hypothetical protein
MNKTEAQRISESKWEHTEAQKEAARQFLTLDECKELIDTRNIDLADLRAKQNLDDDHYAKYHEYRTNEMHKAIGND